MAQVKFTMFEEYSDVIDHGITCRGNDFMHIDVISPDFILSKEKLATELKIDEKDMFFVNQVHDKNIRIIDENTKNNILEYDGLMTNCKGKLLATCYADCVPLLFFDPEKEVIASVHSGWKGTIKFIGREAVREMVNKYGSKTNDILVGIGPSIGPCCFEVNEDVYSQFKKLLPVGAFEDNGKLYVDLWNANIQMLLECGIRRENIECKGICTVCNSERFYSYRKGDKDSGRMAAYIMLK